MARTPGRWHVWSFPADNPDHGQYCCYAFQARQDGHTFAEHEDNAALMELAPQMFDLLVDIYRAGEGGRFRARLRRIIDKQEARNQR